MCSVFEFRCRGYAMASCRTKLRVFQWRRSDFSNQTEEADEVWQLLQQSEIRQTDEHKRKKDEGWGKRFSLFPFLSTDPLKCERPTENQRYCTIINNYLHPKFRGFAWTSSIQCLSSNVLPSLHVSKMCKRGSASLHMYFYSIFIVIYKSTSNQSQLNLLNPFRATRDEFYEDINVPTQNNLLQFSGTSFKPFLLSQDDPNLCQCQ